MSAFSRSLCSQCGPESLHKLGACVGCTKADAVARAPAPPAPRTTKPGGRYGVLGRPRSYDLTDRERQVATLIAQGFTQALVAKRLNVTRAAVCSALKRAMERIGAEKAHELRRYVREGVAG